MRKIYNIGIIGFGFMGKAHSFGYKTIPLYYSGLPFSINLKGICTRTLEKAIEAKENIGFEYATDNPDDVINNPDIDIVHICTPNIFHKDTVIKAMKAGKHVYCDKPLAVSYKEAKEIIDLPEYGTVVTQMALQNRFFPATMRAKQLIDDNRIGNIISFRACYLHSGSVDPDKPIGWKQDKSFGGGGVLYDLGSHIIDLLYYLMGEYQSIFAKTKILYKKRPDKSGSMIDIEADDIALIIAHMKNGAIGTIEASKIATGTNDELRFEIHGDKGALRFNLMEPNWLEYYDNTMADEAYGGSKGFTKIECIQRYAPQGGGFPGPKFSIGWIRAHVHCLYSFLNAVNENKKAEPSFEDGAYIQYVMEKTYDSDRIKSWVNL